VSTDPRPFNAIPSLQGVSDQALLKVLTPIKENLERVLGLNGSRADLYLRADDAVAPGGETTIIVPDDGPGEPLVLPIPIIEADDITATGTYERIILSWSVPYDYWLAHYEILRSSTSLVGDAVVIGSTTSMVYSDPVGPKKAYYYWIRIVQKVEAGGNVGALPTDGKPASTTDDPSHVLDLLSGRITATQLYADLSSRIDLVDGTGDGSVTARIAAEAADRAAALASEATARAAALASEATARAAALASEATARAGADSAIASDVSALELVVYDEDDGVAALGSAISTLGTRMTSAEGTVSVHTSQISSLASLIDDLEGGGELGAEALSALDARVTTCETNITANASDITALEATVNNSTTGVSALGTALGSLTTRVTAAEGSISSLSTSVTSLQSDVSDISDDVSAHASALGSLDSRVTATETSTTSHAGQISALEAIVGDESSGNAAIAAAVGTMSAQVTANAGGISAQAESIETLQTTVGGHTASIETQALSIGGLSAQYTVKIDADGKVIGLGLASGEPGEADSSFIVRADKFAFCLPTGAGATPVVPFVVGNVGGEPTVGVNGQLMVDGSISTNALAAHSVTADILSVDRLSAISANMGAITGGSMNIGNGAFRVYETGNVDINAGTMKSVNYVPGTSGWRLTRTGALDLTNLQCIGTGNIQDAAVTTLKIGPNAATLPIFGVATGHMHFPDNVWTYAFAKSIEQVISGQPIAIFIQATVHLRTKPLQAGKWCKVGLRCKRDGTTIHTISFDMHMGGDYKCWMPTLHTVSAPTDVGTHTYSVEVAIATHSLYPGTIDFSRTELTTVTIMLLGCRR
jgi:hypothetical protein